MLTLLLRDILNQDIRLAFMYIRLSVHLKLLKNKVHFKIPCQNHARKAEKTSNFYIEAKS